MTRKKKIFLGVAGAVLVLLAAVLVVLATLDWNRLKPTINEQASAALGRPFAIQGDLSVQWAREPGQGGWRGWVPWPHFVVHDVAIVNTVWARDPNLLTLRRGEFRLAPLPLLRQRVVIRRIQLSGLRADLQRRADGVANWEFTMPDTGEPSPWKVDIDAIGFDQGAIRYADAIAQADLDVLADPLGKPVPFAELAGAPAAGGAADQAAGKAAGKADSGKADSGKADSGKADSGKADSGKAADAAAPAAPPDYAFGWQVNGRYKDLPLEGTGKVGGMLALRDARQPFPVQAEVAIGSTRIAVAGTLTDPMSLGALDLRLKLASASMANLYPLTGVTLPDTPPYSTDGRLVARLQDPQGARFEYRDFNGKVGASDLHGDITFALQQPRPRLSGKLSSRLLRMADLGPLIGVQSGGAKSVKAEGEKAVAQPADKVLPVQEFRTDRWRVMDADVELRGERIVHSDRLPISDLTAHVLLDDGVLTLAPLRFGMAGGSLDATLKLDGRQAPMSGNVRLAVRRLRLKQLFPNVQAMQKALGEVNGDVAISGQGNSVAALLGSASGETKLLVNDGVISRALMEIAGLNVGNYVVSKLFGDDEVKINCAAADMGMTRGVMTPRVFVIDTENAVVNITGSIDFRKELLNLDIDPDSKGFRLFSLRSPLYVKGSFKKPDAGVHVGPLAARGAGAVALGILLTPAAGLLALIAPSTSDDNHCATLLTEMRKPAQAPRR
ncbi:AsmA family protein [Bordetella parapertussis]|uniref:AsmA family protein n=1 Tax=Bordetella parapertussis TaxID=519 RepID=UPI000E16BBC8|nr:AsmA family protein [Bordetella parapertussis]MEB2666362.1 AsmA family protein [Bordetella parapertussis]QGC28108.1 AsmA family protein [Bordetella parapertussis]SUV54544.1 putative assembly protein [Bordetella parapertussis]